MAWAASIVIWSSVSSRFWIDEVVVLEVHIEVRVDERIFDGLPDDASHLVAVELDDGAFNLDLCQWVSSSLCRVLATNSLPEPRNYLDVETNLCPCVRHGAECIRCQRNSSPTMPGLPRTLPFRYG